MNKQSVRITGRLLGASLIMMIWGNCAHSHDDHKGEDHTDSKEEVAGKHEDHGDETVLSPEAVKAAGLEYETTERGDFHEVFKCSGVIENARGEERIISAPASGIVSLNQGIVDGANVKAGQGLFSISSQNTEQGDQTATYGIEKDIAYKELQRAERLIKDNLISRQEYDRIKADYDKACKNTQSVSARNRNGICVSSPISGTIINLSVRPGSFVNMGDQLATVVAQRRIMLRAEVSENNRHKLSHITGASVKGSSSDLSVDLDQHNLKILSHNPQTNSNSHFIPVYLEFDNPGNLSSGNVVEVWLKGALRQGVITVPKTAIMEDGGLKFVYVEEKPGIFHRHEVKTGDTDGNRVEIISGLPEGEKIVTEGAVRIKLAGMASSIPAHSHHH